ncbi:MAG: iron-sulfur cluster assembly scaffold protein [Chloroflexota bacterium]|nr:iron-sulfur cluster assembly scaffold protein [Chloroflexota bacterium]MDE2909452.1 iron-sulfur cluster assembly scaffold protein [Chloroflexota bacterium]
MEDMYRELILDHARNQRNWALLKPNDFDHEESNPLCGDRLRLTLRLDEAGRITEVGWDGEGCAICLASASMFGEELIGMKLVEARKIDKQQLLDNIGLRLSVNRVKCALLPLKALVVGASGAAGDQQWRLIEVEGGSDG